MKRNIAVLLGVGEGRKSEPPIFAASGSKPAESGYGGERSREQELAETPSSSGQRSASFVSPDAVAYRSGDETCGHCSHMGGSGTCEVLEMTVEPDDSCMAFSSRGGEGVNEESGEDDYSLDSAGSKGNGNRSKQTPRSTVEAFSQ